MAGIAEGKESCSGSISREVGEIYGYATKGKQVKSKKAKESFLLPLNL
ncbi:hypothetical protein N9414_14393 [Nodularia spumigena CCY9414]|jgi:hypothetical protein|nr:hypothetical protein N9414_14393 [Nodularia spumigena CCY9414]